MSELRRTYTRRLNRTLLKKTGTKNAYLTDKKFLTFFGYDNIEQLVSTQNETNKIIFYLRNTQNTKAEYSFNVNDFIEMHIVKATHEVRLSGNNFSYMLEQHGITETDSIIINRVHSDDGAIKYYMSFAMAKDTMVLQPMADGSNEYWVWDNYDNREMWTDRLEFISYVYDFGQMTKKILRFKFLRETEIEMVARGISQTKKLFSAEEKINNKWYKAFFYTTFKNLEIIRDGDELSIYKRENLSSEVTESEVFK